MIMKRQESEVRQVQIESHGMHVPVAHRKNSLSVYLMTSQLFGSLEFQHPLSVLCGIAAQKRGRIKPFSNIYEVLRMINLKAMAIQTVQMLFWMRYAESDTLRLILHSLMIFSIFLVLTVAWNLEVHSIYTKNGLLCSPGLVLLV